MSNTIFRKDLWRNLNWRCYCQLHILKKS